jgi:transcription elongation factor Elf1
MYLNNYDSELGKAIKCPFCNDKKARATIIKGYEHGEVFTCRNCGIAVPKHVYLKEIGQESNFIFSVKDIEPKIDKYKNKDILDELKEKGKFDFKKSKPELVSRQIFDKIQYEPIKYDKRQLKIIKSYVERLDYDSEMYLASREIPKDKWHMFGVSYDFMEMYYKVNNIDKVSLYKNKRLIIKFIDDKGEIFALKGRSFEKDAKIRYLTINNKLVETDDNTKQPIFGLFNIKLDETVYILEGELDSLFVDNAFALGSVHKWELVKKFNIPKDKIVFLLDNDSDGKNISSKALFEGYKVFSWKVLERTLKYDISEIIDINKLVQNFDIPQNQLMTLIKKCTLVSKMFMHML